ncbi:MAG TPA: FGGY family carbohydrate kinase [Mucilaginibacter sp.]|jgi:sugar (pentulose or hexulose) kinase
MSAIAVIAIFDIGKTNKKLFLFDENYKVVFEKSERFNEINDEDGDVCENLDSLRLFVFDSLCEAFRMKQFRIKAINFSTYGASLVYIDEGGKPLAPLYNYLKPYPSELSDQFYSKYEGKEKFSLKTASPILGSLNSGLQLYRLKTQKPQIFRKVKFALHLPQYLSFLLTGKSYSDITSIGCHTVFWDFEQNRYHEWVQREGVALKLPPITPSDSAHPVVFPGNNYKVGVGLHDSSAALIPYLVSFGDPFVLISTGTWCISLNPFNSSQLTQIELDNDCLSYLQYKGKPVKASRLFSGFEHEQQVARIAAYFNEDISKYRTVVFDAKFTKKIKNDESLPENQNGRGQPDFASEDLSTFKNDIEAYHQLITDLIDKQVVSTAQVLKGGSVKRIFVDGGFSKNRVYMHMLAAAFPEIEIYAASMAQASALGAALSIHHQWNPGAIPKDIIQLNYFSSRETITL